MIVSSLGCAAPAARVLLALCLLFVSLDVAAADVPAGSVVDGQLPFTIPPSIAMNQLATINITWPQTYLTLALCQTTASDISKLAADNTWLVLIVDFGYLNIKFQEGGNEVPVNLTFEVPPGPPLGKAYENFFFCWGVNGGSPLFLCEYYSETFSVLSPAGQTALLRNRRRIESVPREAHLHDRFVGTPTTALAITQSTAVLSILNSPAATTPPQVIQQSVMTVTQISSTYTVPSTATPTSGTVAATTKSSSPKLGIGPIVGIAIGGVIVLLLLVFFAFACIRRRRNDNEAKHTLLHSGSAGSRDVIQDLQTEKDHRASVIPAVPMLSFLETRPASGPFDHLELSEPYSGPAAPTLRSRPPSTIPPVSSTSAAAATATAATALAPAVTITSATPVIPDNMSEASAPLSPRSTVRSVSAYSVPYAMPYTDNPTYGDARHTPQLYESPSQTPTPFLSEPGMSAEELSRLEEEERRIDAAIAEAEAARR